MSWNDKRVWRWAGLGGVGLVLWLAAGRVEAAAGAEPDSYQLGQRFLQSGAYDLAEREMLSYVADHPASTNAPQAVLYAAQARYHLGNFGAAASLLEAHLAQAGPLAAEYHYWRGESLFAGGNDAEAVRAFAELRAQFPDSPRVRAALLGEAYSQYRLRNLSGAVALLTKERAALADAVAEPEEAEWRVRGDLLLAEAYLDQGEVDNGLRVVGQMVVEPMDGALGLRRQLLTARLQAARNDLAGAVATLQRLSQVLAAQTNQFAARLRYDVYSLEGGILERQGRVPEAIAAYERNLDSRGPQRLRADALQRIVQLTLDAGRPGEAIGRLEDYLRAQPNDPGMDLCRVTLAELLLRQYIELSVEQRPRGTNLLSQAAAEFSQVATNLSSPLALKARMGQGWTRWLAHELTGETAPLVEAVGQFGTAAEQLPLSEEQAVARFKLADCLMALTNYPAAISNYWVVATNFARIPEVQDGLAAHALHQVVRAAIRADAPGEAERALDRLLRESPESAFADRTVLLFGQSINRAGRPADARRLYSEIIKRWPGSALVAEVELALARTYQQEGMWDAAVSEYDRWVTNHVNHDALPRVEFDRAWGTYLAGDEERAYQRFTNFMARFPRHERLPWAELWVGDYHFRRQQYDRAELAYQALYQNTNRPPSALTYQARLKAGRAASFRQGYGDARGYFTNLINDPQCPKHLLPELYFHLGTSLMAEKPAGTNSVLSRYAEAAVAFSRIPQNFPESPFVPLAWGEIGNCLLQLGATDPAQYDRALEAYTNALNAPLADVAARSQAGLGLGLVCERRAERAGTPAERRNWLSEALRQYMAVAEGMNLRPNETGDPFWLTEAVLAAARVAEEQERWGVAEQLYRRLPELAPALAPRWQARLERLEQMRSQVAGGSGSP